MHLKEDTCSKLEKSIEIGVFPFIHHDVLVKTELLFPVAFHGPFNSIPKFLSVEFVEISELKCKFWKKPVRGPGVQDVLTHIKASMDF